MKNAGRGFPDITIMLFGSEPTYGLIIVPAFEGGLGEEKHSNFLFWKIMHCSRKPPHTLLRGGHINVKYFLWS